MDRYWLLTWTTYATWLVGDARGFVSEIRDRNGSKVLHNVPGEPYDADLPELLQYVRDHLKGDPVYLTAAQAEVLIEQFRETAQHRRWELLAAAVMANHAHLVVGVLGDPAPAKLLIDFKAYATRALKKKWPLPQSGRFWTQSGSKRKLRDDAAVKAAVEYVRNQEYPLAIYTAYPPASGTA